MTENTNETECHCDGEQICKPCQKSLASWAEIEAAANAKTNALIHHITGGDFLR